jgi:hypothetical protein
MISLLHTEPKFSEIFRTYLLTRNSRVEEDLIDQLSNSSEKRRLLGAMEAASLARIAPHLEPVVLKHAYFPQGAVLSLLTVLENGSALSQKVIRTSNGVCCCTTLIRRFGSVNVALKLAGFKQEPRYLILEHKAKRLSALEDRVDAVRLTRSIERGQFNYSPSRKCPRAFSGRNRSQMIFRIASNGTAKIAPGTPHIQNQNTSDKMTSTRGSA